MKDGFVLKDELKKLPDQPGVYLMHSKSDEIIYVGKAINLKRRVSSYFRKINNRSPKIEKMITLIDYFEYIVTDSELEALVLENNLIKEHKPKYNTMLKDDKSYPFMKVTVQEDYPRVLFARQMKRDGAKYFGPYTSAAAVKDTIELVQKLYGIRTCNKSLPKEIGLGRPCLYHQMKQCDAPCQGYISKEEYRKNVEHLLEFLNGDYKKVIKDRFSACCQKRWLRPGCDCNGKKGRRDCCFCVFCTGRKTPWKGTFSYGAYGKGHRRTDYRCVY